jgi:hypothetical protein
VRRSALLPGFLVLGLVSLVASHAALASDAATAPSTAVQPAQPEKVAPAAPPAELTYGPILATDPEVRGQIKKLYREQFDFNQTTEARIQQLGQQAAAEPDADVRSTIQREAMQLKKDALQRNVELGLQIARLNGDAARVAEFEKALDQITHPEKYLPPTQDPALAQERRLGQK